MYEHVLLLDDDHIPSKKLIQVMLDKSRRGFALNGPYKRTCDAGGYTVFSYKYNYILPGCSVTRKSLMVDYAQTFNNTNLYHDILVKHKGNGDDLCYNHYLISQDFVQASPVEAIRR